MHPINRGLLFVLLFVFGCARTAPAADPKAWPPDDWTHKELAAHLEQKGVKGKVEALPALNKDGRTVAKFVGADGGEFLVFLCKDAQQAREQAGALGNKAAHFNRFAIGPLKGANADDDKLLAAAVAALKP